MAWQKTISGRTLEELQEEVEELHKDDDDEEEV